MEAKEFCEAALLEASFTSELTDGDSMREREALGMSKGGEVAVVGGFVGELPTKVGRKETLGESDEEDNSERDAVAVSGGAREERGAPEKEGESDREKEGCEDSEGDDVGKGERVIAALAVSEEDTSSVLTGSEVKDHEKAFDGVLPETVAVDEGVFRELSVPYQIPPPVPDGVLDRYCVRDARFVIVPAPGRKNSEGEGEGDEVGNSSSEGKPLCVDTPHASTVDADGVIGSVLVDDNEAKTDSRAVFVALCVGSTELLPPMREKVGVSEGS